MNNHNIIATVGAYAIVSAISFGFFISKQRQNIQNDLYVDLVAKHEIDKKLNEDDLKILQKVLESKAADVVSESGNFLLTLAIFWPITLPMIFGVAIGNRSQNKQ